MKDYKRKLIKLCKIMFGNYIYSFAIAYFILPIGMITGGTTGIAIAMNHYLGMNISLFVTIFNVLMFVLGAWVLGWKFAMTTLVSTVVYPMFLVINQKLAEITGLLTTDPMLCTVFAGLLIGMGIGLVIKEGASTGGMDIPPLVLHKKLGLSVAVTLNVLDIIILLVQITFTNREMTMYGIMLVLIYTYVLEKVLVLGKSKVEVKIISEKYKEINSAILENIDRGTTLFEVEGGYTRNEMYAILTVINQRELFAVNELVHEIDPDAFIIIGQVKEVRGRGFTKVKEYQ